MIWRMNPVIELLLTRMDITYAVVLFFFGTAVGSFLNVVIYRLPYGLSLIRPPSSCPKCGKRIFGLDNLPVLSWLLLRGRCRQCKAPIAWRYPGIELLTGLLWAGAGYADAYNDYGILMNVGVLMTHLVFVSTLVAITFIDYDHQIIPDEFSLGGLLLGLVLCGLVPPLHMQYVTDPWFPATPWMESLLRGLAGAAAGAALVYAVSAIGTIGFRKQIEKAQETDPEIDSAIGLGDVKLMAYVGALLGWESVLLAFFIGTCAGAFGGIFVKLASGSWPTEDDAANAGPGDKLAYRWRTGESIIPFGPFLVIGSLVMLFARKPIVTFFVTHVFHAADPGAVP